MEIISNMEVFEQYSLFCVPVGMDLLPPPPSFGVEVCMFVVPEMELWPPCLGVDIGFFFAGPVIENKCKCDFPIYTKNSCNVHYVTRTS